MTRRFWSVVLVVLGALSLLICGGIFSAVGHGKTALGSSIDVGPFVAVIWLLFGLVMILSGVLLSRKPSS